MHSQARLPVSAATKAASGLWSKGFHCKAVLDILERPSPGGPLGGGTLVRRGYAGGMPEHGAQFAFALAVQFVDGRNVGLHGCLLGLVRSRLSRPLRKAGWAQEVTLCTRMGWNVSGAIGIPFAEGQALEPERATKAAGGTLRLRQAMNTVRVAIRPTLVAG